MRASCVVWALLLVTTACGAEAPADDAGPSDASARRRVTQVRGRATAPTRITRTRTRRRRVSPPARTYVRVAARHGGWEITDLFELITRQTGQRFLYEPAAVTGARRIDFVDSQRIPRGRLFEWLQAVLAYHDLVLVPVGSADERSWFCMRSDY